MTTSLRQRHYWVLIGPQELANEHIRGTDWLDEDTVVVTDRAGLHALDPASITGVLIVAPLAPADQEGVDDELRQLRALWPIRVTPALPSAATCTA